MQNYHYPDRPDHVFEGPALRDLNNGFWRVLESFNYKDITVVVGFETDLFTIPRFARWFYPKAMKRGNMAAIVHDYILTHLHHTHTRRQADTIFLNAMRDAGVKRARMCIIHAGVSGYTAYLELRGRA